MESPKLVIFMLIFSLIFPPISYAFSTFSTETPDVISSLDVDDLISLGLILEISVTNNVTYGGDWVYYDLNQTDYRIKWFNDTDTFLIQSRINPIDQLLDSWYFPHDCLLGDTTGLIISKEGEITELEIINYFDNEYNWTRIITDFSINIFWTLTNDTYTIETQLDSELIYVTFAKVYTEETQYSFSRFINWYWGTFTGQNSYGLPEVFSWVLRVITAIQFVCAVWVIKDVLRV